MCGIAGIFGAEDPDCVRRMTATLVHRGPDDGHAVWGPSFSLGARRLSIIDLDGGRQPIANEDGSIWVAQNGEIYNFPGLREWLLERGHVFRTRCDTEVLVHLYEELGPDFPTRLEGMYAIAIWDGPRRRGLLVRDRLGKKPLYYHLRGDRLYFGSEIKALLAIPGFERRLDAEALHHFLSFRHVPHPLSAFAGVSMLPPASLLEFRPGSAPVVRPHWELDFSDPIPESEVDEEALADELLARLRTGVRRRLISDVPVGFFLSGGVDSSLVTALAAEASNAPLETFTLVYEGESETPGKQLDRKLAGEMAQRLGTRHHEELVRVGRLPEEMPRILRHFDEPFAGVMSSYFLSRAIARHVKVALCGDGADELFGSYLSHRLAHPIALYLDHRASGRPLPEGMLPFEGREGFLEALAEPDDWRWRSRLLTFDEAEKRALYAPAFAEATRGFDTVAWMERDFAALTARDPLNRMLEAELKHLFVDQVLTYADRLSMAHSLEVRSPFLDSDLVSFTARLPGPLKIRGPHTKYLLKRAAARYLPPEMLDRPKEGFLLPMTQWLLGDLEPFVRETLSPEVLARQGLFDPAAVTALVDRIYAEDSDYTVVNKVFALLAFQQWHALYL